MVLVLRGEALEGVIESGEPRLQEIKARIKGLEDWVVPLACLLPRGDEIGRSLPDTKSWRLYLALLRF